MTRAEQIKEELANLPTIYYYDSNGEKDEDAYQEYLEQIWHKKELMLELENINKRNG